MKFWLDLVGLHIFLRFFFCPLHFYIIIITFKPPDSIAGSLLVLDRLECYNCSVAMF